MVSVFISVRLRTKWLWVSQCGEGTDVKVCLGETMTNKLTTDKCIAKYIGLISVKGRWGVYEIPRNKHRNVPGTYPLFSPF